MSDPNDDWDPTGGDPTDDDFDAPTITCQRCDQHWDLSKEFDELGVGNHAIEQFALDHKRHTGHFPDDVRTWRAACRNCPETAERLASDAATRWAETHARHTRHEVEIRHARSDETTVVTDESE
ncbi:hypothetical protein [Halorussus salinisoli]|uniref:hypothetical protein n=1 Tax=Halorussus salinisoli TaxID=2558242 RepID=UPI0010C1D6E9|nr:hypothetical protein [Halorussus salinisoli]